MSEDNIKYFKTNQLHDGLDELRMETNYEKGRGYRVDVSPCMLEKNGFTTVFSSDYFKYSGKFLLDDFATSRKNKGKEAKAIEYMNDNTDKILKDYCKLCLERGNKVEILWEYSHSALNDKIKNELQNRIIDKSQTAQEKMSAENLDGAVCGKILEYIESKDDRFTPYELKILISAENTLNSLFMDWLDSDYSAENKLTDMHNSIDSLIAELTNATPLGGIPVSSNETMDQGLEREE